MTVKTIEKDENTNFAAGHFGHRTMCLDCFELIQAPVQLLYKISAYLKLIVAMQLPSVSLAQTTTLSGRGVLRRGGLFTDLFACSSVV